MKILVCALLTLFVLNAESVYSQIKFISEIHKGIVDSDLSRVNVIFQDSTGKITQQGEILMFLPERKLGYISHKGYTFDPTFHIKVGNLRFTISLIKDGVSDVYVSLSDSVRIGVPDLSRDSLIGEYTVIRVPYGIDNSIVSMWSAYAIRSNPHYIIEHMIKCNPKIFANETEYSVELHLPVQIWKHCENISSLYSTRSFYKEELVLTLPKLFSD